MSNVKLSSLQGNARTGRANKLFCNIAKASVSLVQNWVNFFGSPLPVGVLWGRNLCKWIANMGINYIKLKMTSVMLLLLVVLIRKLRLWYEKRASMDPRISIVPSSKFIL